MRSLFGNLHTPSSFSPISGQPPGRPARGSGLGWLLVCVLAGALQAASLTWPLAGWSVPGLTPGQPSGWLQIASLALLVLALQHAGGARAAAWRGWLFATAWLVGTFWWPFVSMHTYGGLAAWLAALAVLALAAFLALYYALAAALLVACAPRSRSAQAVLFAAVWTLAELVRGRWLTGFPWGAGGYAQVDLMAAWAPWVGVYGMGALAALLAYALASLLTGLGNQARRWLLGPARQPAPGRRPGGRRLSAGAPGLGGSSRRPPFPCCPDNGGGSSGNRCWGAGAAVGGSAGRRDGGPAPGQLRAGLYQFRLGHLARVGGARARRHRKDLAGRTRLSPLRQTPPGAVRRIRAPAVSLVHRPDAHPAGRFRPGRARAGTVGLGRAAPRREHLLRRPDRKSTRL